MDLQDNAFNKEWTKDMSHPDDPAAKAQLLDWDRYLDFVEKLQFNYLRGWIIWSTGSGTAAPPHRVASPMPFLRTGPGNANDGKPKFDLHRFDESFFQLMRHRARTLQDRGVYLSAMGRSGSIPVPRSRSKEVALADAGGVPVGHSGKGKDRIMFAESYASHSGGVGLLFRFDHESHLVGSWKHSH